MTILQTHRDVIDLRHQQYYVIKILRHNYILRSVSYF